MNPKQHAKRNTVLRVIAFLLIVALVYGALALLAFNLTSWTLGVLITRLLTINNATEQQYIRSFYLEPKNSLDVMILGASETFTDYCAPLAWQHAGFTSYPLAVSAAQGTLYASMLRESAKRQSPTVYVVEVNGFLYTEDERKEQGRNARMARHAAALTQQGAGHSRVRTGQAPVVLCTAAQIPRQLEKAGPHPQFAVTAAAGARRGLLVHQAVSVHLHVPHGDG